MRAWGGILTLAVVLIAGGAAYVIGQNTAIYCDQGGAGCHIGSGGTWTVESGGILNVASGGALKIGGTSVTATASQLNAIPATTATATELNKLAGVTAGTTTASKALVVDANSALSNLAFPVSGLKIGAGAGTAVDRTAAELNGLVQGVAAGYKVARGEVTLDGSNPTPAATSLTTVVACSVTHKTTTAPAVDPNHFTVDYGGAVTAGTVNVYAWKVTSSSDTTMIASTNAAAVISYVCVGT